MFKCLKRKINLMYLSSKKQKLITKVVIKNECDTATLFNIYFFPFT